MTTPGVLARRKDGAWVQDGSYILTLPNAAALPNAPTNDDVFAFLHDTQKLMRSRAGAWVEFTSGGGATAGYFAANIISQAVPNVLTTLKVGTPGIANGFTLLGDGTVRCDLAGTYVVTACVSLAGGPGNWQILNLVQMRGATAVRTANVVGQGSVNASLGSEPAISSAFTLAANDVVVVQGQADTTGRVTDGQGRSTFVISAVGGAKGDKGDAGSLGTARLDDLNDVTIATTPTDGQMLVYEAASSQWKPRARFGPAVLHQGAVDVDLGSQTSGGLRDIVNTNIPAFSVATRIQVWAFAQFGFGSAGPCNCTVDLVMSTTGANLDTPGGILQAVGGAFVRVPLYGHYLVPASGATNSKVRINGVAFSGGNCYMRGRVDWLVTEQ